DRAAAYRRRHLSDMNPQDNKAGERPRLDGDLVRQLQERAAQALHAEHVRMLDGWWLRHTRCGAWWAGTVLPHTDPGPDVLASMITEAERFYAATRRRRGSRSPRASAPSRSTPCSRNAAMAVPATCRYRWRRPQQCCTTRHPDHAGS